jgi:hypothetical protein
MQMDEASVAYTHPEARRQGLAQGADVARDEGVPGGEEKALSA